MKTSKPSKPTPDFPLFPHASGQWAKKIGGKLVYFGPWADPDGALARYQAREIIAPPATTAKRSKTSKPHPDFPLYLHPSGQYAKKILGKTHYFGSDRDEALEKWLKEKDDLLAGREPSNGDGLTVGRMSNLFLASKQLKVDSGELTQRSWQDYHKTCQRILKVFGPGRQVANLCPADFEKLRADLAKTHGPVALYNDIGRARVVFNYAAKNLDTPVRYGDGFDKPGRKELRKARQAKPPRMYQADELRKIIDKAGVTLRAMILLGANCGLNNMDCALLPTSAIDLKAGWLTYARNKTGVARRCPLWPETAAAVKVVLAKRPDPKNEAHRERLFITKYGTTWEAKSKSKTDNPISKEMVKVLKDLGLHRPGLSFGALRHTFETIGKKARDKDAVRAIMGHVEDANDMSAVYDEEPIEDGRLKAVTDFVRAWLFPKAGKKGRKGESKS